GNDFQDWRDTIKDSLVRAVAEGIRSADRNHIQTSELNYPVSASLDDPSWRSLIGLNAVYTYKPAYAEVLRQYDRRELAPVYLIEANYEFENGYEGPETLRRQEYWTLLSGASGQFYGNKYTWRFSNTWMSKLNTS